MQCGRLCLIFSSRKQQLLLKIHVFLVWKGKRTPIVLNVYLAKLPSASPKKNKKPRQLWQIICPRRPLLNPSEVIMEHGNTINWLSSVLYWLSIFLKVISVSRLQGISIYLNYLKFWLNIINLILLLDCPLYLLRGLLALSNL